MKCTSKYVGLDVHQATTVASVRGESGRVIALLLFVSFGRPVLRRTGTSTRAIVQRLG